MSLRRVFDSILTRLLLLGLCLVIFGSVTRYFALSDFLRKDLGQVVASQQSALAAYVARDIDDKISQRQAQLDHLAASLPQDLLGEPLRLRAWLKEHYDDHPLFTGGLVVVDRSGIAIADYPLRATRVGTGFADRDYVQAGLAGRSLIGRPLIGRTVKEAVLPMAVPIVGHGHQVRAVLVGVTQLAAPGFLDALSQSRLGEASGGFLLISPRDELFVASSRPEMVLKPTPPPGINALHDRAMAGFRGTGMTRSAEGVEELSAIASVPSADWFVVARLPTSEAFATVDRLQNFLLRNALLLILAFVVLASSGLYFVFRPLFHAAQHADRMTRGELPLEPLPVGRNDEVGHLLAAFNRLLLKLNDQQVELSRLARHDGLTGLPNRTVLADRLELGAAQARRNHTRVGLLFMDLDGFKQINDRLGHDAGDAVLRQVAVRLGSSVRQADTLARLGGDEFVLLLSDLGDNAEEAASQVAAKCIDAMHAPFLLSGTAHSVGVSIGIALGNAESSLDSLLQAADQAMYRAKNAGRGRYALAGAEAIADQ